MALTQLVNDPYKSIDGLTLTNDATAPDTIINVALGQARDSTNALDMELTAAVDVDISTNGLNGLDTGSAANNTLYYLYIIADQTGYNPTGCILSTSASQPQMPAGISPGSYSNWRLIGCMRTDGSADFLPGRWFGNHTERTFFYDTGISALSAGTAATATAVSLANLVPAFANALVYLDVLFATTGTAGDYVQLTPYGSAGANIARFSAAVTSVNQRGQLVVPYSLDSSVPKIAYVNSAANGASTLLVAGFNMSL